MIAGILSKTILGIGIGYLLLCLLLLLILVPCTVSWFRDNARKKKAYYEELQKEQDEREQK